MGYELLVRKHDRKFFSKSKNRICTTIISHLIINKSNHFNILKSDNVIVTSKFSHRNVQNCSSFNTLIALPKVINIYSLMPNLLRKFTCGQ